MTSLKGSPETVEECLHRHILVGRQKAAEECVALRMALHQAIAEGEGMLGCMQAAREELKGIEGESLEAANAANFLDIGITNAKGGKE